MDIGQRFTDGELTYELVGRQKIRGERFLILAVVLEDGSHGERKTISEAEFTLQPV